MENTSPNFVIKEEVKNWLIDCSDEVRLEEVKLIKESNLQKIKNSRNYHGYKFEYDMWKLFLSLGPNFISNPNENAKYNLKDIPTAVKANKDHQNDLVVYFDKHIFIIECKSTKSKRPKSYAQLQEDAVDTFNFSQIKNKRLKQLYGNSFIPVHSVCTKGYKIGELDQENSFQERKIFLITEQIRNYISTVIEVSGSEEFSFNQLLGLFRSGKPDYGKKHIRAFSSKSGKYKQHNVYTFSISPKEMIPISTVSHQAASKIYESKDKMNSHYQRLLTKRRIQQVADFLENNHQPFPNNILVNYRGKKKLQFERSQQKTLSKDVIGNIPGTLIIDACPATFHVIDGQHRLFGYTGVEKKPGGIRETHRVLVTAFENLNAEEEADVFLDVNTNAKPIKPGLVMEIEYSTEKVFKRNLATSVVFKLREKEDSALKGLIAEAEGRGALSPKDLQSSLLECKTLIGSDIFTGIFWDKNLGEEWENLESAAERIYQHVNTFLLNIKKENSSLWRETEKLKTKTKNGLLQNIIIGGLFIVLDKITENAINIERPYQNKITAICNEKYYGLISNGLKNDDPKIVNDKMLQVSFWFGAGKNGQKNVANTYIYKYLKSKRIPYDRDFVDLNFNKTKTPDQMKEIQKLEKKLAAKIVLNAHKIVKRKYKRNTKGKIYSNAFKIIIKYVYLKHNHLQGDPWDTLIFHNPELIKEFARKIKLHEDDCRLDSKLLKETPWRKLEAPEFINILSNPKYLERAVPISDRDEHAKRIKDTKAYIWNNLTIFKDKPYPHNLPQPKDNSSQWKDGFEYLEIFYKFRGFSSGKSSEKIEDRLMEPHTDQLNTLKLRENEFPLFDEYEKKFKKMSKRIAEIYEIEKGLLKAIIDT